ncbi:MAG: LysR family transcriptional regulator [Paracoccaceae bacterium]|nr:LysR family transcriptional regulator [Paracoccaceae bacterium]
MQFDPRHLEILAAIVDAGGVSEGAARLGKSQPSLSRSIALLEARVGAPLFEKGRRPLQPTALGSALAEEGRIIRQAREAAAKKALSHSRGHVGTIRIGGTPVFMDGVASPMLATFQQEYPELRLDQSYGFLDDLLKQLESGQIDLAICPIVPSELPEFFDLQVLLPGRNVIACGASHPLARRTSLRLDDIAPYPWIAPPTGSPLFRDLRQVLSEIGIKDMKVSFSGGSLTSIINVLLGSEALTVLPYSVLFTYRDANAIHALPIKISHPERQLGLLKKADVPTPPTVHHLSNHLTLHFQGLSKRIAERERIHVWRA